MDPSEFLATAEMLLDLEGEPVESEVRTSIGRSYYAVFLIARDLVEQATHREVPPAKSHALMKKILVGCSNHRFRALGISLQNLHTVRKRCDYEPYGFKCLPEEGELNLKRAADAIDELEEIKGDEDWYDKFARELDFDKALRSLT